MFPYSTDRQLQRTPWATIALIAVCCIVEGICLARFDVRLALALQPDNLRWWQPATAMFAHADPIHLVTNMVFLWVFGSHVEDAIGIPRYLLLYLTAGLAGNWLQPFADHLLLHDMRGGIGASGAIMGLVAVFALRYRSTHVNFAYWYYWYMGTFKLKALWAGLMYLALDLVIGLTTSSLGVHSRTGHFAHIGGFACGVGWCLLLRLPDAAAVDEESQTAAELAAGGAFEAAGATLEGALEHDADNPELWAKAASYLELKDVTRPRAARDWSQALRLWLDRGEAAVAAEHWRQLRQRLLPEWFDPEVLFDLAVELEQTGRLQDAMETYSVALRAGSDRPGAPAICLRHADLCVRAGETEQARQWYEYLERHWPDSQQALEVPGRLRRLGDSLDIQLY